MPKLFRPDMPRGVDARRWTVGVLVSSRCARVSAALMGAGGSGRDLLVEVVSAAAAEVPRQTTALFNDLSGSSPGKVSVGMIAACRAIRLCLCQALRQLDGQLRIARQRSVRRHSPCPRIVR